MSLCDPIEEDVEARPARDLPEGVPPLRAFYLYLSNSCNLACRHCWITPRFVDGKPFPGDVVDVAALARAVDEALPLGLARAKLTGGEPLLHPRFLEIADSLSSRGLGLDMETNGTLLTRETARHLKERTRMGFISVSIDGADAGTHDRFRGVAGSWQAALRGLGHLAEAGYANAQVIMCVHRGNLDQVEGLARLAAARGAGSVKLNPVTRAGRGAGMHEKGEGLGFDEFMALARRVREELRPKLEAEGLKIGLILHTPLALTPLAELRRTRGRTGACGVRGILGILGTGEIALCGIGRTVPELVYGRLGEDSIRDIWLRHPAVLELRRLLDHVAAFPGICGRCVHAKGCRTGCVAENYVRSGRLAWPDPLCEEAETRGVFPASRRKPGRKSWPGSGVDSLFV